LARATNSQGDLSLEALAERIEALEKGVVAVASAATAQCEPEISTSAAEKPLASAEVALSSDKEVLASPAPPANVQGIEIRDDATVLNRQWSDVLEQISDLGASRMPLYANARLRADIARQSLLIEYSQSESFKHKQAGRADNKELLSKAIASVFGREVPYKLVLAKDGSMAVEPAAVPTPPPLAAAELAEAPAYEPVPDEAYGMSTEMDVAETAGSSEEIATSSAIDVSSEASVLEPTPPPAESRTGKPMEVATLLDELGATKISEISH